MRHLSTESIARMVDERPLPEEAAHLEHCLHCRAELRAMRRQTESLAALATRMPPAGAWARLESRLRAEGIIRDRSRPGIPLQRIAASLAFLALLGAGSLALQQRGPSSDPRTSPVRARFAPSLPYGSASAPAAVVRSGSREESGRDGPEDAEAAPRASRAVLASSRASPTRRMEDPALLALLEAEAEYHRALAEYARLADTADPLSRLALLEAIVRSTRGALERAPEDPVVNGYYLAALDERESTVRELARRTEEAWY